MARVLTRCPRSLLRCVARAGPVAGCRTSPGAGGGPVGPQAQLRRAAHCRLPTRCLPVRRAGPGRGRRHQSRHLRRYWRPGAMPIRRAHGEGLHCAARPGITGALQVNVNSCGRRRLRRPGDLQRPSAAHKGRTTIMVDGLAASIASVIVQAGQQRVMQHGAMLMVHDAFGCGDRRRGRAARRWPRPSARSATTWPRLVRGPGGRQPAAMAADDEAMRPGTPRTRRSLRAWPTGSAMRRPWRPPGSTWPRSGTCRAGSPRSFGRCRHRARRTRCSGSPARCRRCGTRAASTPSQTGRWTSGCTTARAAPPRSTRSSSGPVTGRWSRPRAPGTPTARPPSGRNSTATSGPGAGAVSSRRSAMSATAGAPGQQSPGCSGNGGSGRGPPEPCLSAFPRKGASPCLKGSGPRS